MIKRLLKRILLNYKIGRYEIVHIMNNDKFNKNIIDTINKYFDTKKHCFLYCGRHSEDMFPIPKYDNVFVADKITKVKFSRNNRKFILHSLFAPNIVPFLYARRDILEKSYWVMWGGDLYSASEDEAGRFVRENMKGVCYLQNDKDVYIKKYGEKPRFFNIIVNSPISKSEMDAQVVPRKDFVRIQINNSADFSTIEALKNLSKFSNEKIRVTTVLSYGQTRFNDDIIATGKEFFGDKFEPMTQYIPKEVYLKHLASNDILILNQDRQQGLGNLYVCAYLGQKCFVRGDISVSSVLNAGGIKIYDTESLENITFAEFLEYPAAVREKTVKNVSVYFDDNHIASLWSKVFDD